MVYMVLKIEPMVIVCLASTLPAELHPHPRCRKFYETGKEATVILGMGKETEALDAMP